MIPMVPANISQAAHTVHLSGLLCAALVQGKPPKIAALQAGTLPT